MNRKIENYQKTQPYKLLKMITKIRYRCIPTDVATKIKDDKAH